jgi:hypothetical protein
MLGRARSQRRQARANETRMMMMTTKMNNLASMWGLKNAERAQDIEHQCTRHITRSYSKLSSSLTSLCDQISHPQASGVFGYPCKPPSDGYTLVKDVQPCTSLALKQTAWSRHLSSMPTGHPRLALQLRTAATIRDWCMLMLNHHPAPTCKLHRQRTPLSSPG